MDIRHTKPEDLTQILNLYDSARAFMRKNGNMTQWGEGDKPHKYAKADIELGLSYVCCEEDEILAVFVFVPDADDPTYHVISDGEWPKCNSYGVLHRIAVGKPGKDVAGFCLDWCAARCAQLRVDTHADNHPMQKALTKNGFVRCGIIQTFDGSDRIAFARDANYTISENNVKRKRLLLVTMSLYTIAVALVLALVADILSALEASRLLLVPIFILMMIPGCLMSSKRLRKGGHITISPDGITCALSEQACHGFYPWQEFISVKYGPKEKTIELLPKNPDAFYNALPKRARTALRQQRIKNTTLPIRCLLLSKYDRKRVLRGISVHLALKNS